MHGATDELSMHESFVRLATRLIKKNGRPLSLIEHSSLTGSEAWDPGSNIESEKSVIGVQIKFKAEELNGELKLKTEKVFLIDTATAGAITLDMRIKDENDVSYSILHFDEVKPGETSILYKVYAGR